MVPSFALIYTKTGILNADALAQYDFSSCFYFSVVTWTTLGYGDFSPTPDARLFASLEALVGYVYIALAMGIVVATIIGNAPKAKSQ